MSFEGEHIIDTTTICRIRLWNISLSGTIHMKELESYLFGSGSQ